MARARLLQLAPGGFEEREDEGELELAAYVEEAGEAAIRAALDRVRSEPVDEGWGDRWREFHRAVRAGGLWIGPPWERPPAGERVVVVDPGRAFGTGAHPTTRACIELLARLERGSLLDAGCGSGVLAVAACRLDFDPVHAVDADPVAVQVARTTARANGVAVEVSQANVLRDELPRADVVVANIELRVVESLLARRPAPIAVTSGYLAHETPAVQGWGVAERVELEGWGADAFRFEA